MTMTTLPHSVRGAKPGTPFGNAVLWARKNLFSSGFNSLLTLLFLWLLWELVPPLLNWVIFQANWVGTTRADCTKQGACWVFIHARFGQFMYGLYPTDQRWRINTTLIVCLLSLVPMFTAKMPRRGLYVACWAVAFPVSTGDSSA
jgi:general L-amino acid transport system permease protein